MRQTLAITLWILSVVHVDSQTTIRTTGPPPTFTATFRTAGTAWPVRETIVTSRPPNTESTTEYVTSTSNATATPRHDTYPTSRSTPRPTYTTTASYTDDYWGPSTTTEPVDRTNYGTRSTHFWFETTTAPPHYTDTTTRATDDYSHEMTPTMRSTPRWTDTTSRPSTHGPTPGETVEKTITVEPFKNLMIRLARDVVLRSTSNFADHQVKLICSSNTIDFLSIESHDGTLAIAAPSNCDVEIQGNQFERVDIGAVRSVSTANYLHGNRLSVVSGQQTGINLTSIRYDAVDVMILGVSSVFLDGSTGVLDVTQLGVGTFDGRQLSNQVARVFSRNYGLILVSSTNALSLFVSGPCNVVWCSPQIDIKTDSLSASYAPNIRQLCY